MADVTYVHHKPAEYRAFRSPTGMTGRWLHGKTEEVAAHARLVVPKPGQGKGYATGKTAASIKAEKPAIGRTGPESRVIADTDYSIFVHNATAPHIIKPRVGKRLMFFWRRAGQVVYSKAVKHPGTKANPFLTKALKAVFGGPGR